MLECGAVSRRVVGRSILISTMSRKKLTDELVAMVLEHHDSDDNFDSLYGFSSEKFRCVFKFQKIITRSFFVVDKKVT